ncbi:beta-N-acetylhexosaminidase [Bacillus carboniphilus]|uniref:Beta-N-acetylhexosaminidase n=1 Tax=Bacillus carboniphilus TaxID=86663 RepID=A0ABN0W2W6_9BACI
MKICFKGNLEGIEKGIDIMSEYLDFTIAPEGMEVHISQVEESILHVSLEQNVAHIQFQKKIHFFRGLGLLLENIRTKNQFTITETPQFDTNGVMLDCSRNGVMTTESIEKMVRHMALMGLNLIMLYTEDTYEVEGEPYFGYLRGRYTQEELRKCDEYAELFGIEMVPCIQTLAHLQTFLRWRVTAPIKESADILLVGEEKTYDFIKKIIKAASAPFKSNRIHIGMDEAFLLGRGKYLDLHGLRNRYDIMNEHLHEVMKITRELDLKPMIWSDMYFRISSKSGGYYDPNVEFSKDLIEAIPNDIQFVYWDYYHENEEHYKTFLNKHFQLNSNPVFAGGIWTWNGVTPHYKKTFATTNAALSACKSEGVKEVFATMWGDNGQETNVFSSLLGMQLYAEHGYSKKVDQERLKNRFKFCTGGNYDSFFDLGILDLPHNVDDIQQEFGQPDNPSKYLLWQDIMVGIFDKHVEGKNLSIFYSEAEELYQNHVELNPEWVELFKVNKALAAVLNIKSEIGNQLQTAYKEKNKKELEQIESEILPLLTNKVQELKELHRNQWMSTYKPFGWEVLDIRYGGVLSRIDTARYRLKEFLAGQLERLEELEEERLFVDPNISGSDRLGRMNLYNQIATVNPL